MDERTTQLNDAARARRKARAHAAAHGSACRCRAFDGEEHGEGCDCDECARRMVADTFAGPNPSDAEPRCPNCGAGMDELELDDEDQRAFCSRCATEGPAEDCIHAGVQAATERWMVCLDGGPDHDGDDDLDRWDALVRARSIRTEHPDALVTMVLLPQAGTEKEER